MYSHLLLIFFVSLLTLSVLSLLFASLSIFRTFRKTTRNRQEHENEQSVLKNNVSEIEDETQRKTRESDLTHLTNSLLLKILPSDSNVSAGSGKKKKRGKKKKLGGNENDDGEKRVDGDDSGSGSRFEPDLVCLYPFTSTGSATQRKIKQQYDQLVKCNEAKGLTLAQIGEFANCLIEARSELQHKSEVIKRKFTITKALLCKADRSSFERLHQQICKLEMEQKRLEEDAFVYNWLQQQLKLSPAYKRMLEICTCMELKEKSGEPLESQDTESSDDISFEELLAQEKKDSFWQKNGKSRTCASR